MTVEVRRREDIVVFDLVGKMTTPRGDTELREAFRERVTAGDRRFVFNFTQVPMMDSAAIAETVACRKRLAEVGGDVNIVLAASGRPREVFEITRLDRVFEIFETVDEAIGSFSS